MLYILPCLDKSELTQLGVEFAAAGVLKFIEDEKLVGALGFTLGDSEVYIDKIYIDEKVTTAKEFFIRSVLYKMLPLEMPIRIGFIDENFYKLGFKKEKNTMIAGTKDIVFPCECGGK